MEAHHSTKRQSIDQANGKLAGVGGGESSLAPHLGRRLNRPENQGWSTLGPISAQCFRLNIGCLNSSICILCPSAQLNLPAGFCSNWVDDFQLRFHASSATAAQNDKLTAWVFKKIIRRRAYRKCGMNSHSLQYSESPQQMIACRQLKTQIRMKIYPVNLIPHGSLWVAMSDHV